MSWNGARKMPLCRWVMGSFSLSNIQPVGCRRRVTIRPAVAPAKWVPMTSTGVPARRWNILRRVSMPCSGSLSASVLHSGCAIWQGWCMKSPVISACSPRDWIIR